LTGDSLALSQITKRHVSVSPPRLTSTPTPVECQSSFPVGECGAQWQRRDCLVAEGCMRFRTTPDGKLDFLHHCPAGRTPSDWLTITQRYHPTFLTNFLWGNPFQLRARALRPELSSHPQHRPPYSILIIRRTVSLRRLKRAIIIFFYRISPPGSPLGATPNRCGSLLAVT